MELLFFGAMSVFTMLTLAFLVLFGLYTVLYIFKLSPYVKYVRTKLEKLIFGSIVGIISSLIILGLSGSYL